MLTKKFHISYRTVIHVVSPVFARNFVTYVYMFIMCLENVCVSVDIGSIRERIRSARERKS